MDKMANLTLDIDEKKREFIIIGGLREALDNPAVKFYLKNFLNAEMVSSEKIVVKYEDETRENILKKIRHLLERYGLNEDRTERIKDVLQDYFIEEKNFIHFSEKAKKIRENQCDKDEFKRFVEVIKSEISARALYPLQLLSAYHLAFSQNSCNFSVPGSGKTSIVYGAFSYLRKLDKEDTKFVDKILIIGPLSSFGPWEDEYKECFGRKVKSKRLLGSLTRSERIDYLYSQNPAEITLISYQGVLSLVDDIASFLRRNKVMIVLDEAHRIKNVEGGITAESILALAKYAKSRVVLTGTPVPNGLEDLYNLYKFIWPSKEIIKFHMYQLKQMSSNAQDGRIPQLINNISPFFIRIKKSDLGLPPPNENPPISVPMGNIQKHVYEFLEKKYMGALLADNDSQNVKNLLTKARLIRLMQAATNPSLLKKPLEEYFREQGLADDIMIDDSEIINSIMKYDISETPAKFIEVEKIVKAIIGKKEKVIILTTFVQNIKSLASFLDKIGIKCKIIFGEIPVDLDENYSEAETRESIIKEFHEPSCPLKVLIANPFSVSESISLHKACHNAIYLERTFNAGQFIQSKDRIHRYGLNSDDAINYYYLLSENSIDETIHSRLCFKERRMMQIIEKYPIPLFFNIDNYDMADQDIKAIIDDYVKRNN